MDKVLSRSSVVSLQLLPATTSCCVLDGGSSIEILVLYLPKKYTVEYMDVLQGRFQQEVCPTGVSSIQILGARGSKKYTVEYTVLL